MGTDSRLESGGTDEYVALVTGASTGIGYELAEKGVTVTAVCPGPTDTPFMRRGNMEATQMVGEPMMDAATVARVGYDGLKQGKRVVVPGSKTEVVVMLKRMLPRKL
ncbi:MAG: hypothetical protein IH933_11000 [Euryarchaeota archaeon]|nr:hypothetical protein [Euryarchaeota archaeon]